jgi:uncharacterized membrane protein YiaA
MALALRVHHGVLVTGIVIYTLCLWGDCPQLTDKGYFLLILVLGLFAIVAYRRLSDHGSEDTKFATLCSFVLLTTTGLLLVGIWNQPLPLVEKGLCAVAWFASMYGAARCR